MTTMAVKESPVRYMRRIHLFHPGRYYAILGGVGTALSSILCLLIALPSII